MPRAEALRLGPFVGGMNIASDPTAVADSELVSCLNFELDIDGSLISRPPIVETTGNSATWTERIVIIGRGVFPEGNYIIGSNANGTYAFNGTTWTTISSSLNSHVALQYQDFVWIPPSPTSTGDGGKWSPSAGFTADVNMPHAYSAIFHKSRMFVVPGNDHTTPNKSRLRFTDPITSATFTWTSTNIIDVSPGDGQVLQDLLVVDDNLMLFKTDSTFILAYDVKPTDAILRQISSTIGVTTKRCVAQYEDSVFAYHEGNVYEIMNYDFARINLKVPFVYDSTVPSGTRQEEVFLSLLGDRLVVGYYNKRYVYGLKTRTWSEWKSENSTLHNFGPLVQYPANPTQSVRVKYYAGSSISNIENVVYVLDGHDSTTKEGIIGTPVDIICKIKTKNYDLADSHHFKKLMWWGADILTTRNVTGVANPIANTFRVTWAQMGVNTWGTYSTRTWGTPLTENAAVTTPITNNSVISRLFVKFLKTLRFRQINFEVILTNDGTTGQGPARVFTLTAIVGSKQTVPKQVN